MTTSSYTAADRGSLDDHIASFLTELTAAGYAPHRRAQRRSIVYAFKDWCKPGESQRRTSARHIWPLS